MKTPISIMHLVRGYSLLQCSNSHATVMNRNFQVNRL